MFGSSIVISWLSRLFLLIGDVWRESYANVLCRRLASWFSRITQGSAIIWFVKKDGYLVRVWDNSITSRLLDWLLNLIPNLLNRLYTRFEITFNGSLLFRFIRILAKNVPTLTALFIAVALVVPADYWDNMYATIAVIVLFCLFLIDTMTDRKVKIATKAIDVCMFIFMLAVVLAQAFSVYPSLSLRFFIFYMTDFMLMLLLVSSIKTRDQLATVIEIIVVGAAICGLYGLYQMIKGVPVIVSQVDLTLNEGMPGRVFSSFDNCNDFGEMIIMLIPFFIAVVLNSKGWQKKLLFGVAAIPLFISLLASYFRSGYIGFVIMALVFIFLLKRSLIPLFIILGIVAYPFLPETVTNRISTITNLKDTSISTRLDILKTMWPVIKDFWYTGLGLGSDAVKQVTGDYVIFAKVVPLHAHDVYLQVWLEMGIVGLVSFLGSMLQVVKKSMRAIFSKNTDPYCRNVLIAGLSGLAGVLVIAIAEYVWYYPRIMLIFWMLIGIMLSAIKLSTVQEKEREDNASPAM